VAFFGMTSTDPVDSDPDYRVRTTIEIFEEVGPDLPGTTCFKPVIAHWETLSEGADIIPPGQAFGPDSWSEFLGRISVLDPIDDGRDFRYAIHAGAIVHAGGVDMTGRHVSEFPYADFRDSVLHSHRTVFEARKPAIWRFRHIWRAKTYDYCTLYLPVRKSGDGSIRLHTIIVNTDPSRRRLYTARFVSGQTNLSPEDLLRYS
jgi:hypothetical protein